jgi:hypothetical protein
MRAPSIRRSLPRPDERDHRRVRAELARLDPWSFWVVPPEQGHGASYAVVGTTGAFEIALCVLEGYAQTEGAGLRIGDARLRGFREVKGAARAAHRRLHDASVFVEVDPVICLVRAQAGASRTVRGVRVVRLEDLAASIAQRERALEPTSAKRGAQALGTPIASGQGSVPDIEEPPEP